MQKQLAFEVSCFFVLLDTICEVMVYYVRGETTVSQWDKLIDEILVLSRALRFEHLAKALVRIGYTQHQPRGGSSHFTFRKSGKKPITLPKSTPMNKVYIEIVRDAVLEYRRKEAD